MAEGVIKRLVLDRGFGFIRAASGEELFFHRSSVQGVTFESLAERQRVTFTEGRGPKGAVAENVCPA